MRQPKGWDNLKWWESGERQAVEERIDEQIAKGYTINPARENIYRALSLVPFDQVKVCIIGQDPYPEPQYATGVAFSIPTGVRGFPPSLVSIFSEYSSDLHYPTPTTGNLERWCADGVLLWNAVPTCEAWKSLAHQHWPEWPYLTTEIISTLSTKGITFVGLGNVARSYLNIIKDKTDLPKELKHNRRGYVNKGIVTEDNEHRLDNTIIELSHPSPRASRASKSPFFGSRLFSRVNDSLVSKGYQALSWQLS